MGMTDDRTQQVMMPEAYREREYLMPHVRGFLGGLGDPMGLPSIALNALTQRAPMLSPLSPGTTDWWMRYMQERRNESPIAAGMGSGAALGPLIGAGAAIPAVRAGMPLGSMGRDALSAIIPFSTIGGFIGRMRDDRGPYTPPTPQAEYQPSGAY